MGWYRTHSGRLIYGKGGLAEVYERRGWTPVTDEDAQAEVASGEAQTRADVEGELAAEVDAKFDADKDEAAAGKGAKPTREHLSPVDLADDVTGLLVTDGGRQELTDDEKALVDKAIREES